MTIEVKGLAAVLLSGFTFRLLVIFGSTSTNCIGSFLQSYDFPKDFSIYYVGNPSQNLLLANRRGIKPQHKAFM